MRKSIFNQFGEFEIFSEDELDCFGTNWLSPLVREEFFFVQKLHFFPKHSFSLSHQRGITADFRLFQDAILVRACFFILFPAPDIFIMVSRLHSASLLRTLHDQQVYLWPRFYSLFIANHSKACLLQKQHLSFILSGNWIKKVLQCKTGKQMTFKDGCQIDGIDLVIWLGGRNCLWQERWLDTLPLIATKSVKTEKSQPSSCNLPNNL